MQRAVCHDRFLIGEQVLHVVPFQFPA